MQIKRTYIPVESEIDLINSCKIKNRKAQQQLYDRYKTAMYTCALRIIGDSGLASEALQDAFIDVFEQLDSFRFESSLGAWIKTIVIRKSFRKLKNLRILDPLDLAENIECKEWHGSIDAEFLEKAIQSLPIGTKSVFLLIEVEGYKHLEVANILNISEGTSKSQLHYAKKLLQKILYEYNTL